MCSASCSYANYFSFFKQYCAFGPFKLDFWCILLKSYLAALPSMSEYFHLVSSHWTGNFPWSFRFLNKTKSIIHHPFLHFSGLKWVVFSHFLLHSSWQLKSSGWSSKGFTLFPCCPAPCFQHGWPGVPRQAAGRAWSGTLLCSKCAPLNKKAWLSYQLQYIITSEDYKTTINPILNSPVPMQWSQHGFCCIPWRNFLFFFAVWRSQGKRICTLSPG